MNNIITENIPMEAALQGFSTWEEIESARDKIAEILSEMEMIESNIEGKASVRDFMGTVLTKPQARNIKRTCEMWLKQKTLQV